MSSNKCVLGKCNTAHKIETTSGLFAHIHTYIHGCAYICAHMIKILIHLINNITQLILKNPYLIHQRFVFFVGWPVKKSAGDFCKQTQRESWKYRQKIEGKRSGNTSATITVLPPRYVFLQKSMSIGWIYIN